MSTRMSSPPSIPRVRKDFRTTVPLTFGLGTPKRFVRCPSSRYILQHTVPPTIVTKGVTMNSSSVPSAIENTLKMWTFSLQDYSLLTIKSVRNMFPTTRYFADLIEQMDKIGVGSSLIVVVALFCVCGVVVLKAASPFVRIRGTALTAEVVFLALLRELGPVFVALLVAG